MNLNDDVGKQFQVLFEQGRWALIQSLALVCDRWGNFQAADRLYQRALRVREKTLGPDHPSLADSLNSVGFFYEVAERYDMAEPLYQRALQIREKVYGGEHLHTARSLSNLARLYQHMGAGEKAKPLYQRELQITEKLLGREHAATATIVRTLGRIYQAMGDYAKAEQFHQRQLSIHEKVSGPMHPETANSLIHLGMFYDMAMSDDARAESLYQRALNIRERAFGPEHQVTANALHFLTTLYQKMGNNAKAEPLYQRALEISEKGDGPKHFNTAVSLSKLAALHLRMGEPAKAEPLYQRTLEIARKLTAPKYPRLSGALLQRKHAFVGGMSFLSSWGLGGVLNELATEYERRGDCPKAESLRLCELNFIEKEPGLGHGASTESLNSLTALYRRMGNSAKAETLLLRSLNLAEQTFGAENTHTATKLESLGRHYAAMGEHEKAEPFYRRALKINESVYEPESEPAAWAYKLFGWYLLSIGKKLEALEMAAKAVRPDSVALANVLSFAPESQRLTYLAVRNPYGLLAAIESATGLAAAVLRHKGVVLDSLLEDRLIAEASQNPEHHALAEQLRAAKQRAMQLLLEVPQRLSLEDREKRESERAKSVQEVEQLEGALARELVALGRPRRALSVTVEQVRQAIPKDTVLLELIRYWHSVAPYEPMSRYGAVVLSPCGEPKWVSLGEAAPIETNLQHYQEAVRGRPAEERESDELVSRSPKSAVQSPKPAESFSTLLQTLYQQLWTPIEAALPPQTKTVIISPDGALNFLSFATLLAPDDQFLSQKYSIRYVASGRDLLREFQASANAQVTVFANPDFGGPGGAGSPEKPTPDPSQEGNRERSGRSGCSASLIARSAVDFASAPGRSSRREEALTLKPEDELSLLASAATVRLREVEMRDFAGLHLPPLPGTARESALLAAQARQWNWPMQLFDQARASKSQLHAVQSPRILHLATHGFFLPDTAGDGSRGLMDGGIGGSVSENRGVGGVRPLDSIECAGESASFLRPRGVLKNPMHRSGLALAGAQATLDAWGRGETPPSSDDGIMTAAEVGTLTLEGTDLVVLSACETGAGEAKSGEGVLGLRRGFIQAGAKNLLMTLWSVADEETAQFMADFYERFHATGNAPEALAEVQRDWLVRLRRERGLREAVLLAGPFLLSSQGLLLMKS